KVEDPKHGPFFIRRITLAPPKYWSRVPHNVYIFAASLSPINMPKPLTFDLLLNREGQIQGLFPVIHASGLVKRRIKKIYYWELRAAAVPLDQILDEIRRDQNTEGQRVHFSHYTSTGKVIHQYLGQVMDLPFWTRVKASVTKPFINAHFDDRGRQVLQGL